MLPSFDLSVFFWIILPGYIWYDAIKNKFWPKETNKLKESFWTIIIGFIAFVILKILLIIINWMMPIYFLGTIQETNIDGAALLVSTLFGYVLAGQNKIIREIQNKTKELREKITFLHVLGVLTPYFGYLLVRIYQNTVSQQEVFIIVILYIIFLSIIAMTLYRTYTSIIFFSSAIAAIIALFIVAPIIVQISGIDYGLTVTIDSNCSEKTTAITITNTKDYVLFVNGITLNNPATNSSWEKLRIKNQEKTPFQIEPKSASTILIDNAILENKPLSLQIYIITNFGNYMINKPTTCLK